jgi:hypothetical protein
MQFLAQATIAIGAIWFYFNTFGWGLGLIAGWILLVIAKGGK